jgi:hypothetical protein
VSRGNPWWREPPWWAWALNGVSAVVLVVGVSVAHQRGQVPPEPAAAAPARTGAAEDVPGPASSEAATSPTASVEPSAPRPVAAFLGDSFLDAAGSIDAASSWPMIMGEELGWAVETIPLGEAGMLVPGPEGTFGSGVPAVIATDADVVVVAGGYADADVHPAAQTGPAARAVLEEIRAGLPEARIVLAGPFSTTATPTWGQPRARDALAQAAAQVDGVVFVDPLPWFADGAIGLSADGAAELDQAGHRALADRFTAAVRDVAGTPAGPATAAR